MKERIAQIEEGCVSEDDEGEKRRVVYMRREVERG